jgi:cephalosporin hydroxylase
VNINFFGLKMSQNENALVVINNFLKTVKPNLIIEIGTYTGGLSALLQIYSNQNNSKFITYDIKNYVTNDIKINQKIADVFLQETIAEIKNLIQENKTTALFCDGGNKIKEFNTFAQYLKIGDYILAHDYSKDREYFKNEIQGKIWNSCEITDKDIQDSCKKYSLTKFLSAEMQTAVWTCWKKS